LKWYASKFRYTGGVFIYIIVGGHLAEKIGRTECIAMILSSIQETVYDFVRDAVQRMRLETEGMLRQEGLSPLNVRAKSSLLSI
jgi:phenylalanine-4-hydroxylase